MALALVLATSSAVLAFLAALAAGQLVQQARSDDATALHRLHRSAIVAAVIALVAGSVAWGVLARPEDSSTAALLVGLVVAILGIPGAIGLALGPIEARLRGHSQQRGAALGFLAIALCSAALWTGIPFYVAIATALRSNLDAATSLLAAPLAYGIAALLGFALAPLLPLRLLGRADATGPEGGLRCRVVDDLGHGIARAMLAYPALRPTVLLTRSAVEGLDPESRETLVAIEQARHRLGLPRRRLLIRLIASVPGSIAGLAAWVHYGAAPPLEAFYLVPPLLDAWALVMSGLFKAREDSAADRAAAAVLGVERVSGALGAADAIETRGGPGTSPGVSRRQQSLATGGDPPAVANPVPLAVAALVTVAVALSLVRLAFTPSSLDLAMEAVAASDFDAAEGHFRDAVRTQPEDPSPAMQLAWTLAQLGRDEEAREWADRAVTLAPGDHDVADERSHLEELLGMRSMSPSPHLEPVPSP